MQRSAENQAPPARRIRPVRIRTVGVISAGVIAALLAGCSDQAPLTTPDGKTISTTTTRVAEVNIVNAERDLSHTCLAPTAPDAGVADVARIVVTDPSLLDPVCALGLGAKVTAVAAGTKTPGYLGPQLTSVPVIGPHPSSDAAAKAAPDVVLTTPRTAGSASAFGRAHVATIPDQSGWEQRFQAVADALGRSSVGRQRREEFHTEATKTGTKLDAAHNQVSLIRFTGDGETVAGGDTFAGQILSTIGIQRPVSQRTPRSFALTDKTFKDADGDLIYVSFVGHDGLDHGKKVLLSDRWLDMGAPTWKRVLSVNDEIWYGGSGLAAAWLVLNDVKASLDATS